jgi:hypothetical protein
MRLKIQEQSELNFVNRIIQWLLAIGNCPASAGLGGSNETYVSHAKMVQFTGKKMICFYCASLVDALPEVHA